MTWEVQCTKAFAFDAVSLSENKNGSNIHRQQPVIGHQDFCLCTLEHIPENDPFLSVVSTTVVINIVLRETATSLPLFTTYSSTVWFRFVF